jgi:NAD(P)H-flavin reductase
MREVARPWSDPMVPAPARVRGVRGETADTTTLMLEAPGWGGTDGQDGPDDAADESGPDWARGYSFLPGQFNMLYIFGVGEVPISLSGDPGRPGELVHTVRAVGAVSTAIIGVGEGGVVGVRGPYGHPWPLGEAAGGDLVLIAGGLGLAPLRPVVYHILRRRGDFGRVVLLVGARSPEEILYRGELEGWGAARELEVRVTVDRAPVGWPGRVGVVPALLPELGVDPGRPTFLVCGPEVMMRFTVRALHRLGVPDERIHLSMERNMKCAVGFCGHCQYGPNFICMDGPVQRFDRIRWLFWPREV